MASPELKMTSGATHAERANVGLHDAVLARLPSRLSPSSTILDVGCGTGAWLERLANGGYTNLRGIDYDVAQSVGVRARIDQVDLNRDHWAPVTGRFELITCIEVVEHIENLGNFFACLRQHLDEGGSILMTTPNVESLAARTRLLMLNQLKQFDTLGDPTHISPIFIATLERILARKGLRIAERWGYPSDHRNLTSRGWVNLLCASLRPFLPEPVGGDNLCMRLVAA
jgi:2-polyprenyl-3-methyl-5-hydroxy-6-metoxy-1,4-benzoquinol methylase